MRRFDLWHPEVYYGVQRFVIHKIFHWSQNILNRKNLWHKSKRNVKHSNSREEFGSVFSAPSRLIIYGSLEVRVIVSAINVLSRFIALVTPLFGRIWGRLVYGAVSLRGDQSVANSLWTFD